MNKSHFYMRGCALVTVFMNDISQITVNQQFQLTVGWSFLIVFNRETIPFMAALNCSSRQDHVRLCVRVAVEKLFFIS